ncbi:hypothetical protein NHQ30_004881 [Ciborinia camelliae]|nr:hypothetical protein NHQ30_004881 [Ciborinia camelliae]
MNSVKPAVPIASGQPGTNVGGNAQRTAVSGSEEVWDEAKLEEAMKTLKEMHIQQAATTSNKEVRDFTRLMRDDEGVKLFEHAKKSRAENPHGIKPWRVTQHPDWLDRDT